VVHDVNDAIVFFEQKELFFCQCVDVSKKNFFSNTNHKKQKYKNGFFSSTLGGG